MVRWQGGGGHPPESRRGGAHNKGAAAAVVQGSPGEQKGPHEQHRKNKAPAAAHTASVLIQRLQPGVCSLPDRPGGATQASLPGAGQCWYNPADRGGLRVHEHFAAARHGGGSPAASEGHAPCVVLATC